MAKTKFTLRISLLAFFLITTFAISQAQDKAKPAPKQWYEHISIRGYTQVRYNRLLETNDSLKNEQGDKS